MAKFFFLILIFTLCTLWLYLLHLFAPSLSSGTHVKNDLKFPSNLNELQIVAEILKEYSVNHWWYVFLIFSSAYVYKQSFCIPGSLFLNLLSGALYGHVGGLLFACLFTAIGATICYFLSHIFAKDLVFNFFQKRFPSFEENIQANKDNLFFFMLFIRLVPITPGWVINVVAPLLGVPVITFFITTFFGLVPYNFVGVSAGGMISSLGSVKDVFTWKTLLNISVIAAVAIAPACILKIKSQKSTKIEK